MFMFHEWTSFFCPQHKERRWDVISKYLRGLAKKPEASVDDVEVNNQQLHVLTWNKHEMFNCLCLSLGSDH